MKSKDWALVVVAIAVALVASVAGVFAEPEAALGKWEGTWVNERYGRLEGGLYLTVKKVSAVRVEEAILHIAVPSGPAMPHNNRDLMVTGTLKELADGSVEVVLNYGNFLFVTGVVNGNTMSGTILGASTSTFVIAKK
jgi:hypothetical protein